jgi:cytochrome c1
MLSGTGSMPAQSLTNQEAADVLAYLRATFG